MYKELVEKLINLGDTYEDYSDNDISYVLDVKKDENKINITIELNEDKKDFEAYLKLVNDDLFYEVMESLSDETPFDLEKMYNSKEGYKTVIEKVTSKIKELASEKIKEYQKLL